MSEFQPPRCPLCGARLVEICEDDVPHEGSTWWYSCPEHGTVAWGEVYPEGTDDGENN